jgi:hypothetical protein
MAGLFERNVRREYRHVGVGHHVEHDRSIGVERPLPGRRASAVSITLDFAPMYLIIRSVSRVAARVTGRDPHQAPSESKPSPLPWTG